MCNSENLPTLFIPKGRQTKEKSVYDFSAYYIYTVIKEWR